MMLTGIFLLFFVVGPLTFRALTRAAPSPAVLRRLAILTASLVLSGLVLRYAIAGRWGSDLWLTGLVILLIWFGWIAVLAFAAQALRRTDPGRGMRRWTGVVGAVGTTVPWFGLILANVSGG